MKTSIYNICGKAKNEYILLNTLTNAVARIDDEMKRLLDENPDSLPEDILEMFLENGFVVEDTYDEKKVVAYHFDRDKYNVILRDLTYTVVMTYMCNLGCPYCSQGLRKDTEILNSPRVGILLKNIDENFNRKDFDAISITLYGGEPLIAYRQCVQLMEGVSRICDQKNKELRGNIITNGVLINKEIVDNLLKPYCSRVQITMDGGREAHNRRKTRKDGSGTYDTLLDVLELLRDADMNVNLRLNVDKENLDSFTDLNQDLRDRGLKDIKRYVGWVHPIDSGRITEGCADHAESCFSDEEIAELEDQISRQLGILRVSEKPPLPFSFRHSPCIFDREDACLVDPYLDIYKCWEFVGRKDKKVGHINESGEAIYNYEYYEQLSRNPLVFKECRVCKYLPFCAGGCAAQAYFGNGTYHSSPCGGYNYLLQKLMDKGMERLIKRLELSISDVKP